MGFRGSESIQLSIPSKNGSPFCQLSSILELLSASSTAACTILCIYKYTHIRSYMHDTEFCGLHVHTVWQHKFLQSYQFPIHDAGYEGD